MIFGKIESMRLDKYLKVSRIIKRDVLEITFGEKKMKFKISEIKEHVLKADAKEMYEIVE